MDRIPTRSQVIAENKKLHSKIVQLEIKQFSTLNRVAALESENKKLIKKGHVKVVINKFSDSYAVQPITPANGQSRR